MNNELIRLGKRFHLTDKTYGKITEVFADGFHYHTMNLRGDCIKGQQYMLKAGNGLIGI